jgi:hypothetical protein
MMSLPKSWSSSARRRPSAGTALHVEDVDAHRGEQCLARRQSRGFEEAGEAIVAVDLSTPNGWPL